ncbi:iron-sulfur cluster assembly accessory protein [Crocosphaera sp. XPORK-15E]|uniref:HesB/IscA family protein n=1 Tax=Crocosphaera sp. XPORK-15E TaxID=3110247 RepID=UPI002B210D21|nr:iron-sulfur cluster assembly accessory protein [Crocosphaera sp. XPORK-15E]MEA5537245.1 iron-sulfur cluster assembly accessory protein [Crocosphaera sp. XPORK-15E]
MIELTPAAVKEIKRIQKSRQQPESYFRLAIAQGGCSGLYYALELCETVPNGEQPYDLEGVSLIIESKSLPYLENLRLDYAEDLMGGGFRFHNPNAQATCRCGLSFTEKV